MSDVVRGDDVTDAPGTSSHTALSLLLRCCRRLERDQEREALLPEPGAAGGGTGGAPRR